MLKIIKNEWYKNFFRMRNYIAILFILVFTALLAVIPTIFTSQYAAVSFDSENWETEVQAQIETLNQKLMESDKKLQELLAVNPESMEVMVLEAEKSEIAEETNRLDYALQEGIQPVSTNNLFDNLLAITSATGLITFLTVIIAVSMITDEFSSGTIKLLLIRAIPRYKILLSKFIALFLYVLFYLSIAALGTILISFFFSEVNPSSDYVYSTDSDGFGHDNFYKIFAQNIAAQIFLITIISTIAFSLSVIFTSKSLALSFTLAIYFAASPITQFLSQYTDMVKFTWFANWDLKNYLSPFKYRQNPVVETMTLQNSLMIDFLYLIPLILLTFYIFQKKEIV